MEEKKTVCPWAHWPSPCQDPNLATLTQHTARNTQTIWIYHLLKFRKPYFYWKNMWCFLLEQRKNHLFERWTNHFGQSVVGDIYGFEIVCVCVCVNVNVKLSLFLSSNFTSSLLAKNVVCKKVESVSICFYKVKRKKKQQQQHQWSFMKMLLSAMVTWI